MTSCDYSPGGRGTPGYGGFAEPAELEVLAMRYFNERGEEVGVSGFQEDLAWRLVEQHRPSIEEACTAAGYHSGVGTTHPLYTPGPMPAEVRHWTGRERRMAPSSRERGSSTRRRKLG